MDIFEIQSALEAFGLRETNRPVVVYSALWPIMRATRETGEVLSEKLFTAIDRATANTTLLMPTFTGGYREGICNLDEEASQTGALSEYFRLQPSVRRTVCAFFSFAVRGPLRDETVLLRPKNAWGQGSLYEWMYNNDAHIVTIGLHPTHCSYTHYAEYLKKDLVPYRFEKRFGGEIVHEGKAFPFEQTLFVRKIDPEPTTNNFTWLDGLYKQVGHMKHITIDGVNVSEMSAREKIDIVVPQIEKNPFALIQEGSGK